MTLSLYIISLVSAALVALVWLLIPSQTVAWLQTYAPRWIPRQVLFDCQACTSFWLAVVMCLPFWLAVWVGGEFTWCLLACPFVGGYLGFFFKDALL